MAYAGICTSNVQSNSDPYFHAVSIASMNTFMVGAGNCAANTLNSNGVPVIAALSSYNIPNGTAFVLTGSATDPNAGAALTYCWEQTNAASGTNLPTSTQTTGPIYRSFNPTTSPKRYFPKFSDVMDDNLTPAWEVTPSVARTLNFALTVRDNQAPNGGQTARANMTVTTTANGPFNITFPNVNNTSWAPGSTQTITWNVANTTAAPVNTATVNILFSTDNGVTFTPLVSGTPNDGSENVTLPNTSAPYCRILIEPVGNIYYALSKNISLGYLVTTNTICTPYTRTFSPAQVMATGWTAYNIPAITDSYTISDANFTIVSTAARANQVSFGLVKPGSGVVDYTAFDGPTSGCNNTIAGLNVVFDDEGANFACAGANSGAAYKPVSSFSTIDGLNSAGTWRLAAKSTNTANTMSSVTLTLCRVETTVTLSTESFVLQDFAIYPNPNNGNFTVKLTSNSANKIKVGVHDLRGRLVFENDFQNTGAFNQEIQLGNVQAGIYLVTVQDGDKKEVKKIVIE
jgi:hypothetical protein